MKDPVSSTTMRALRRRVVRALIACAAGVDVLWIGRLLLPGQTEGVNGVAAGTLVVLIGSIGALVLATWWIGASLRESVRNEENARAELATQQRDLTAALRAVRVSEARKTAILDSALDAVISIDHHGIIVEFNPAAERMFGYAKAVAIGGSVTELLVPPMLHEAFGQHLARYREAPNGVLIGGIVEVQAMRADGAEFPVELTIAEVDHQSPAVLTGNIRNIAERRRVAEQFRLAIEASPTGMILADQTGLIVLVNRQVEEMFGYARTELIGHSVDVLIPERLRGHHPQLRNGFLEEPSARAMGAGRDLYGVRRDGTEVPIEIGLNPIDTADGRFVLSSIVGIADRKRAEEERNHLLSELQALTQELAVRVDTRTAEFRLSEERFRSAFEEAPIGIALIAPDGRWLRVNRSMCELVGYSEGELLATNFQTITHPDDLDADMTLVRQVLDGAIPSYQMEKRYFHKSGHVVNILLSVSLVRDLSGSPLYFISQIQDITERKRSELLLRDSHHQQEVLLKEIHHRVKNNLAAVSSLFYLESIYAKDEQAVKVFEESQRRVRSMALVHEILYGSGNLAEIDFAQYARVLAGEVLAAYRPLDGRIQMTTELDSVKMSIDLAIPCGLILNELISNAFKHAFVNDRSGHITIALRDCGDGMCLLDVTDDGVGIPPGLNIESHDSLGLRLIRSLARQIRGTFELVAQDPGTQARLTFSMEEDGRPV
ncbi:MAG: PAS domain S-box protein [bacterium]